jgi:uncharacterized protein with PQ loop repeat
MKKLFHGFGWFGNILLSIGVFPQVVLTWRTHDVESFSWSFLLMWTIGVFLTFLYILYDNIRDKKFQYPLLLNYFVNILGTSYLVFAKIAYMPSV